MSRSELVVVANLWLSRWHRKESASQEASFRSVSSKRPPQSSLVTAVTDEAEVGRAGTCTFTIASAALLSLLIFSPCLATEIAPQERRSGYAEMSRESKAMQDDDTANPGMLAVLDGEALWSRKVGAANRSCADCHGDATESMRGVAARYPAFDAASGKPLDLEERINLERTERQKAPALRYESDELLALSAYVARQSRGEPIAPPEDARLAPFTAAGRDFFDKRQGQLNLSCALCHDDNWGKRLAGNIVPQGHPTGYPLYRLEWQSLGSLQRRLRNCISGMRAEVPDYGAPEYVNLELFLMQRARGMPMESPAVRP
jgi:L-cysteine S-thiosulfotransferase